jgi:hypothetical protein
MSLLDKHAEIKFKVFPGDHLAINVSGNFTVAEMIFALESYKMQLLSGKLQTPMIDPRRPLGTDLSGGRR